MFHISKPKPDQIQEFDKKAKCAELANEIAKNLKIADEETIKFYEEEVEVYQSKIKDRSVPRLAPELWDTAVAEAKYLEATEKFNNGNSDKTDLESIRKQFEDAPSVRLYRVCEYLKQDNTYEILSEIEKTSKTSLENINKLKEIRDRAQALGQDKNVTMYNQLLDIVNPKPEISESIKPKI